MSDASRAPAVPGTSSVWGARKATLRAARFSPVASGTRRSRARAPALREREEASSSSTHGPGRNVLACTVREEAALDHDLQTSRGRFQRRGPWACSAVEARSSERAGAPGPLAAPVHRLPEHGKRLVEPAPHAHVLRPLRGAHHRQARTLLARNLATDEVARLFPRTESQQAHQHVGARPGHDAGAVAEVPSPPVHRVAQRFEGRRRRRFERLPIAPRQFRKGLRVPGGQREQVGPAALPVGRGRPLGRFLQYHVRVRSADAQGVDARPPRSSRRLPGDETGVDEEGAVGEIDPRVRVLEVEAGRQLAVVQGQHRLDEAHDPRRDLEVPHVGLDRPDGTEALAVCARKAWARPRLGGLRGAPVPWVSR
jgi:hypothetical protein